MDLGREEVFPPSKMLPWASQGRRGWGVVMGEGVMEWGRGQGARMEGVMGWGRGRGREVVMGDG